MPLHDREQAGTGGSVEDRQYVHSLWQQGDADALVELLGTVRRRASSFARRILCGDEDVDDVLQAADMNAVRAFRSNFDPARDLYAWYSTIIYNAAVDHLRRNKRHAGTLSLDQRRAMGDEGAEGTFASLLVADEDPVAEAELEETRALVRKGVDALPENLMDPVELYYWRGMKYREIAEELGVPEGTVKSRMHEAVREMRRLLGKAA
jgi:RNA polymerase sigma-70 factor (ECF subfamily)